MQVRLCIPLAQSVLRDKVRELVDTLTFFIDFLR